MMQKSSILAQGFLNDVRHVDTTDLKNYSVFDGMMLDEIQINVILKSPNDIENLITMLRCAAPCFSRPKRKEI